MESFLRRALHFFTHDRLLWIVHTTGSFINLQILPVLLVVGFWSIPLLFERGAKLRTSRRDWPRDSEC